MKVAKSLKAVLFLMLFVWAAESKAVIINGWYENGNGADYWYNYSVVYAKDFGDPWKTVATWQNPTHESLTPITEQAKITDSITVSIQAGWSEMLVALLSISEQISIEVTKNYIIPPCVDLATARWKWTGDYIEGGAWIKHSEDRSEVLTTGNITPGYYSYAPLFSGVIVQTECEHGVCPEPGTLLLLSLGVVFIGTHKRRTRAKNTVIC